jgi:hypothetical protein
MDNYLFLTKQRDHFKQELATEKERNKKLMEQIEILIEQIKIKEEKEYDEEKEDEENSDDENERPEVNETVEDENKQEQKETD